MSKHTSGPWKVVTDRTEEGVMCSVYAGPIEVALCGTGDVSDDTERANAHLIAAAPEMLEALKEAKRLLDQTDIGSCDAVDAAIAKAEGRK